MNFDFVTILTIAAVVVVLFLLFKIFKVFIRVIIIVLFLGIGLLTNPTSKTHQLAVQEKARKENIHVNPDDVAVKDLVVASLTQIRHGDDRKTIGVGLFTKVFIFRKPE
ncbi:MAG TPA: hypothetical protein VGK59_05600 [Ohtaekwangia sp.]